MTESDRRELLRADTAFFAALLAGDTPALDGLLGDDFAIVDVAAGNVTGRAAFREAVASAEVRFAAIETNPDEALVRLYGDTGVVVGRTKMKLRLPDGAELEVGSRYTHVFHRAAGAGWRLVSAQGTQIPA
ncbi:MAG TPA: nuclear transport factor 2 family protein [Myxococcota bacterium]|nr:nuclear transport factor 2 family protein [Myxococcota bacterium]